MAKSGHMVVFIGVATVIALIQGIAFLGTSGSCSHMDKCGMIVRIKHRGTGLTMVTASALASLLLNAESGTGRSLHLNPMIAHIVAKGRHQVVRIRVCIVTIVTCKLVVAYFRAAGRIRADHVFMSCRIDRDVVGLGCAADFAGSLLDTGA
jgi:hypothetical protein